MTHEDIVYDRRKRLIEYAAQINNVAEDCRVFSVSRKTQHEWLRRAERYGPRWFPSSVAGRTSPNAMSSEEVSVILAEAVARASSVRGRFCDT